MDQQKLILRVLLGKLFFLATLIGNSIDAGKIIASQGFAVRVFWIRDMA